MNYLFVSFIGLIIFLFGIAGFMVNTRVVEHRTEIKNYIFRVDDKGITHTGTSFDGDVFECLGLVDKNLTDKM